MFPQTLKEAHFASNDIAEFPVNHFQKAMQKIISYRPKKKSSVFLMTMSLWDAMTSKSSNFDLAVAYFIPEIMEEKKAAGELQNLYLFEPKPLDSECME